MEESKLIKDARPTSRSQSNPRPDLHADQCLERVQRFLRDEIARRDTSPGCSITAIEQMRSLADDVDELVGDILRR